MLNGKTEGSSALERAMAVVERTLALTQEVPSLKQELAAERALHVASRAESDRRIAEIDQVTASLDSLAEQLGDRTRTYPTQFNIPSGAMAELTQPLNLSGTDAIRLAMLLLKGDGATAEPIVATARKLEPSMTARNLYNALHRLVKANELKGEGPRGSRHYSFTEEGKTKALAVADKTHPAGESTM